MSKLNLLDYNLIGITGKAGSGKNTACNIISDMSRYIYTPRSFAKPLKDACSAMFGWTYEQMEDRVFKESVDPKWGFSPRYALQKLGTEYGREMLRDDIWIHAMELSIQTSEYNIITDLRFPNELAWVRSQPKSLVIHMKEFEENDNSSNNNQHLSEQGLLHLREPQDIIIYNIKSLGIDRLKNDMHRLFNFTL